MNMLIWKKMTAIEVSNNVQEKKPAEVVGMDGLTRLKC